MGMLGAPVVVDPNGIQVGHFSNTEANSSREAGRGKKTHRSIDFGRVVFCWASHFSFGNLHSPKRTARTWQEAGPQKETIGNSSSNPSVSGAMLVSGRVAICKFFFSVLSFNGSAENNQQ